MDYNTGLYSLPGLKKRSSSDQDETNVWRQVSATRV